MEVVLLAAAVLVVVLVVRLAVVQPVVGLVVHLREEVPEEEVAELVAEMVEELHQAGVLEERVLVEVNRVTTPVVESAVAEKPVE